MSLAGLLAGLAGAVEVLGVTHFMTASYGTTVGFDSIAVALLGRANPSGSSSPALLFGAMRAGAGLMQIEAGDPGRSSSTSSRRRSCSSSPPTPSSGGSSGSGAEAGLAELETVTKPTASAARR